MTLRASSSRQGRVIRARRVRRRRRHWSVEVGDNPLAPPRVQRMGSSAAIVLPHALDVIEARTFALVVATLLDGAPEIPQSPSPPPPTSVAASEVETSVSAADPTTEAREEPAPSVARRPPRTPRGLFRGLAVRVRLGVDL